eukprot:scaffold57708_cov65-Phaeocystis_antarctica.AAC.2
MCGAAQLRQCSGCAGSSERATHEAAVGGPTCCEYRARMRRLGQLLVGSRAFLGLRCCASDRGEGRLSWWRGAGISESRPRGWLGRGRGGPEQVHGGWHALGSCGLLSSDLGGGEKANGKIRQKRRRLALADSFLGCSAEKRASFFEGSLKTTRPTPTVKGCDDDDVAAEPP